jgi:uncharacterized cofD-like protein
MKPKKVVVFGGGTGTFVTLYGLKKYPVNLTAIVNMTDSGGSTGKLRDQYGVLPPGDVRQALVALSDSDQIWRELFLYRFQNGDFGGHNFGNLFLTALEKITGRFDQGIRLAQTILKTKGRVIPITLEKTHLNAKLEDGTVLKTEAIIDEKIKRPVIKQLYLDKKIKINPLVIPAIKEAEVIIIAPGDLYTSILPLFMFSKVVQVYQNSNAKKVIILNLMNKLGQTDNFRATDFIRVYENTLGKKAFNYVIANKAPLKPQIKKHYLRFGETEIINDFPKQEKGFKVLLGNLLSSETSPTDKADKLSRSMLRHDPEKLAQFLWLNVISKS